MGVSDEVVTIQSVSSASGSSRARWWILALIFFTRTALGFQFQTLGSVAPNLTAELGFSYAEIGTRLSDCS